MSNENTKKQQNMILIQSFISRLTFNLVISLSNNPRCKIVSWNDDLLSTFCQNVISMRAPHADFKRNAKGKTFVRWKVILLTYVGK